MPTREQLIDAVHRVEEEGAAYWSAFPTAEFFAKLGEAWSPAENVRHLVKSNRAVTKGFSMPRLVLRVMFGVSRRPSMSEDELRTHYLGFLEAGGKAGKFGPSAQTEADLEAWRTRILQQFADGNRALAAAIARWREADLDRYRLPHPLMGKITLREMAQFAVYHQRHHMQNVERRLGRG